MIRKRGYILKPNEDPQREICYDAEHEAYKKPFSPDADRSCSWKRIVADIKAAFHDPVVVSTFPDAPRRFKRLTIANRRFDGGRYPAVEIIPDAASDLPVFILYLPKARRSHADTLHEIAHVLCGEVPHGPRFAGTLLFLVRRFLGIEMARRLRSEYDKRGVFYMDPNSENYVP